MKKRVLNVGIAGFGMSGKIFQAPFLHADENFAIRKVYERNSERAREEYPYIETVRSFEELLTEDIDLVIISTPNDLHVPMAKKAMLAGKHVLAEKPVAATAAEAEELCRLAKEQGVVFTVFQNRRLDGDFLTVKNLVQSGILGEVLDYEVHYDRYVTGVSSKAWKAAGGKGVDILYDLGVHIIDQAYTLFGMPKEVYADLRKQRAESAGTDKFEVILYYENAKAVLSAGEVVAMPGPHYAVHGRKGSFIKHGMDVQEDALIAGLRPPREDWGREDESMYGTLAKVGKNGITQEKVPTVSSNYGLFHANLYSAITEGAPLMVEPMETVDVLKIIEAAILSNETGARVRMG